MSNQDDPVDNFIKVFIEACERAPEWESIWGKYIDALNSNNETRIAEAELALVKFDESQGFQPFEFLPTMQ